MVIRMKNLNSGLRQTGVDFGHFFMAAGHPTKRAVVNRENDHQACSRGLFKLQPFLALSRPEKNSSTLL